MCKDNKKMDFDAFLNALVKVAEFMFHQVVDDPSTALKALLEHHVMTLYHKLATKSEIEAEQLHL